MSHKTFKYHLSGYVFETNLFFPELVPAHTNATCSIWIKDTISAKVPEQALSVTSYQNEKLGLRSLRLNKFGFVSIWSKQKIEFVPSQNFDSATLRMFMLGSLSMILATSLGYISFHAASVVINGKAILFCANSGSGKSSLAAYFYSKGYTILSDDVINIKVLNNKDVIAFPSVPRIKLSEDGLKQIGKSSEGLDVIPAFNKKYSLPVSQTNQELSYPVNKIVFLQFDEKKNCMEQIKGANKLNELSKHLYNKRLGRLLDYNSQKNKILFCMAAQLEMYFWKRPKNKQQMIQSIEFIENELVMRTTP